jgi:hypothetical protein
LELELELEDEELLEELSELDELEGSPQYAILTSSMYHVPAL